MKATTVTELRENLKEFLEEVTESHQELIVTRPKNKNVVVVSLDDYNALVETAYLLGSPANANRLYESLKQWQEGNTRKHTL